jgi:hypothetical protein
VGVLYKRQSELMDEVASLNDRNKSSLADSLEHIDLSLTLVYDLKKAHEDIAALKDQHSAQLILKQQVIDELESSFAAEKRDRHIAEATNKIIYNHKKDKSRLIGVLENEIKNLATVNQGKIAKAEAQGKQEAHLYWARAIKEKNALLEDKVAFIRKLEATVTDTNNKWLKEMLKRDEFEAAAKKLLHDNAVLVEEAVAMPVAPLPITPDFVSVVPPPSPIDMLTDFKFAMTA